MSLLERLDSIPKVSYKKVAVLGFATVISYVITVALGTLLTPGYSNVSQDISQLTAAGAFARSILNPLFLIYNLLLIEFGLNFYKKSNSKLAGTASIMIVIIGALGALLWLFPIDLRGTPMTTNGKIHILIVSIISLLTVTATFIYGLAYRKSQDLAMVAYVSFGAALLFLISGPIAAVFVASPYAGLLERVPICTFLLWILLVSIVVYSKDS